MRRLRVVVQIRANMDRASLDGFMGRAEETQVLVAGGCPGEEK